ncbi:DNA cytosine methyltransferase [Porticoccaceae bacterium]|nr:DNA cytosine methyltransferase [Porticoccaceae bacterium]
MNISRKRALGFHKNNKRIWLEGVVLENAGLSAGDGVSYVYREDDILIRSSDENPTHKVCHAARGPIIDIVNANVTRMFKDYSHVSVFSDKNGEITIKGYLAESKILERESDFKRRVKSGEPLRKGGAFAGLGLLCQSVARGLNGVGVKTAHRWSNEYSDIAAAVNLAGEIWESAADDAIMVVDDIYNLDFTQIPRLDVLVLGNPCPAFSSINVSGKKEGNGDIWNKDSGTIFQPTLEMIRAGNPAVVILENSKFMLDSIFDFILCDVMKRFGYRRTETIITGQDYGDFERRERLCRVWVSKGLPELRLENLPRRENERTVADVLEPISMDHSSWGRRPYLEVKDAQAHNNHQFTKVSLTDRTTPVFTASYARIQADTPHIPHPERPFETRIFSVSEHCNIREIDGSLKEAVLSVEQGTLPEGKSTRGSSSEAHRLLGNSCCPRAWASVGERVGLWALKLAGVEPEGLPMETESSSCCAAAISAIDDLGDNNHDIGEEYQYALAI